jgi:hypothetical protein
LIVVVSALGCGNGGGSSGADDGGGTSDAIDISDIVAPDRVTTWDPGITSDGQLGTPLGDDGLPQRTMVCAMLSPGANIQAAIDACPEGQVVQLGAGNFTTAATITLMRGVVLRGAGSQGAPGGTTITKTGGGTVLAIGDARDQICSGGSAVALAQAAVKGATTISVNAAAAANFRAGDLALVDIVDDSTVQQGDCPYFKRVSGRSATQRVEIGAVDAAAGTLTLTSPLHWSFPIAAPYLAQITRVTRPVIRWAGIEKLKIAGGSNPGYNGQMAGGVDISNAAYCWVKDVQTDAVGGMHVSMTGTYRCVVRDSYLHHSANYGFGADCYGIVLRCGAADNLVENNIVRFMNKPILFNVSGGGNVIAYNYADNSWATPAEWQEVNIDTHCAFPHMELMEGNYAPHMGATITHGNAGYLSYYRNFASSQFAPPAVVGSTAAQTGNITALQFQAGDIGMNVLGNVLGTAGVSTVYDGYNSNQKSIYSLGGAGDVSATSLYRHGNYDYVNNNTMWNVATPTRALPPSLYLKAKPRWWPASTTWPWVGPDLTPLVGTLPAKQRSDQLP